MTTVEITTRLAGTDAEYHVLRVLVNGVVDGNKVHTSKDRSYIERLAADYRTRANTKKFF